MTSDIQIVQIIPIKDQITTIDRKQCEPLPENKRKRKLKLEIGQKEELDFEI